MKKSAFILITGCLLLCTRILAQDSEIVHTDADTGLDFPAEFGGLDYKGIWRYEDPALGYSLRYQQGRFIADCYVYDHGVKDLTDESRMGIMKSEGASIKDTLQFMEERGDYKNVKFLDETVLGVRLSNQEIDFLRLIFEYHQEIRTDYPGQRLSEAIYTVYKTKIIKIRLTYEKEKAEKGKKISESLMKDVAKIIIFSDPERWGRMVTPEEVLRAIENFEQNPFGEDGRNHLAYIVNYAEVSKDVAIVMAAWALPWVLEDKKEYQHGPTLMGAFIAGNIKPQIQKKVAEDHPYEGVVQVIATYQQLRKAGESKEIPSIEKWIRMQKKGTLREYVQEQSAKK